MRPSPRSLQEQNMNDTVQPPSTPPVESQKTYKTLKLTRERVRKDVPKAPDHWPDILI
jgi:hypothetical protein